MGLFFKKKRRSFTESSKKISSFKNIMVKAAGLIKSSGERGELEEPEYDLEEIRIASESDSYIKITLTRYSYLFFKAGFRLSSKNDKAIDYIDTRFYIMSISTGKPIEILFQEIGDDMVKYSNAFLIKARGQSPIAVNAKPAFGEKLPVVGYFRVDPSTMQVERDQYGQISKWVQSIDGEEKRYNVNDVVHFYLDKEAANAFGTPRIVAALEDVKLLRTIESNIATMIYRFAMPLFHWIIGKAQTGFQGSKTEVEEAEEKIEELSIEGSVVTNEKTEIKSIGAEGTALNAEGYLKYFKERVEIALGTISDNGSQDADAMESQAHDIIKHMQKVFSTFVKYAIINELLLEGGFDPISKKEDRVDLVFNETSLSTKIKVENHEILKYQSNAITFEEMRRNLGMEEEIDESRVYEKMIKVEAEKEIARIRSTESIRVAKASAEINANTGESNNTNENNISSGKKGINPKKNGNTGDSSPDKQAENNDMPENQHGKTTVKIKEGVEIDISEKAMSKKSHMKKYKDAYGEVRTFANNISKQMDDFDSLSAILAEVVLNKVNVEMEKEYIKGKELAMKELGNITDKYVVYNDVSLTSTQKNISRTVFKKDFNSILLDIKKKIEDGSTPAEAVDRYEYRIRFLIEFINKKSYWLSYCNCIKEYGIEKVYVDFDGSKDEEFHDEEIMLANFKREDIPPFHPFCDCKMTIKRRKK